MIVRIVIRKLQQYIPPGYLVILFLVITGLVTIYFTRKINLAARLNQQNVVILSLVWTAGFVVAAIVWRRQTKQPVLWPQYPNALFSERWCSGCSHRTMLHRLSGARNCLIVVLAPEFVRIDALCPFNLAFLPEILGLTHQFPPSAITNIERGRFGGTTIHFHNEYGWHEAFTIWSRQKDELRKALDDLTQLNGS